MSDRKPVTSIGDRLSERSFEASPMTKFDDQRGVTQGELKIELLQNRNGTDQVTEMDEDLEQTVTHAAAKRFATHGPGSKKRKLAKTFNSRDKSPSSSQSLNRFSKSLRRFLQQNNQDKDVKEVVNAYFDPKRVDAARKAF